MTGRFRATATPLAGLWLLERLPIGDDRGFFERLYDAEELRACGHPGVIVQVNRSLTRRRGAVRGLHFQHPPHGEWKVITCLRGRVHDVVVDLRRGSPTFRRHHAVELADDASRTLVVPPGCAHGFQTLSEDCELLYLHSHPQVPAAEGGVRSDDPGLAITWPLAIAERSERDGRHALLSVDYPGLAP